MHQLSQNVEACIRACLDCYRTCFGMVMGHCLEAGGKHLEPGHVRLMVSCSEVCRASAHLMLGRTEHAKHICRECAEICRACADDCERVGEMDACVAACRACAEACDRMMQA